MGLPHVRRGGVQIERELGGIPRRPRGAAVADREHGDVVGLLRIAREGADAGEDGVHGVASGAGIGVGEERLQAVVAEERAVGRRGPR